MTKNQIDYFSAKEQEKHNRATEQETVRSNKRKEEISEYQASEEAAHLRRQDLINLEHYTRMDAETQRHQMASEAISRQTNAISQAHYERSDANAYMSNVISQNTLNETKRHQLRMEKLTEDLNASHIALNNSTVALNSSKALEAEAHAVNYKANTMLLDKQRVTEVMNAELKKQQALTSQSQRELNVAQTVAVKYNTAANLIGGIGKLIGGIKGVSIFGNSSSGYPSSTYYNSLTGLYE